jgi:hypothetical protein
MTAAKPHELVTGVAQISQIPFVRPRGLACQEQGAGGECHDKRFAEHIDILPRQRVSDAGNYSSCSRSFRLSRGVAFALRRG